ncbi:MAG: hypothetical protein RMJ55_18265 [Roseiflexaceae bacterium]|nr:hypothetical protein [Roseiflexaceae bacterium]
MIRSIRLPSIRSLSAAQRRAVAEAALALTCYLALALLFTWPLVAHWNTAVVGGNEGFVYPGFEDASQNIWNMWWVRRALEEGRNPFWTPLLYYPEGVQMYLQTMNLPDAVITLPINYLAGPIAAYNVAVVLAFTLTGYAGFLAARMFATHTTIALLCGALLTASPFHMVRMQVNHLNLISMQWVVLAMIMVMSVERRSGWKSIVAAAVLSVIASLTSWYWAIALGFFGMAWCLLSIVCSEERPVLFKRYALIAVIVIILLLPVLIGMVHLATHAPVAGAYVPGEQYTRAYSADLFALFHPAALGQVWGKQVQDAIRRVAPYGYSPDGWYIAPGWTLLGCATIGIWRAWRAHWRLIAVGASVWLFALGPSLRILGNDTGFPLPYALIANLPLVSSGRKPALLSVVVIVILTMFAATGLEYLVQRLRSKRQSALFLASVGLFAAVELWPPVDRPIFTFERHALFEQIAHRPGAVADLPFWFTEDSRSLRNQMIRGQPILGGYVARWPEYASLNMSLFRLIADMDPPGNDIVSHTPDQLRAVQCFYPIRHVVVRRDQVSSADEQRLASLLAVLNGAHLAPQWQDDTYLWYELPQFPNACRPFLYPGSGWYEVERTMFGLHRWGSADNTIWLVNPYDTPIHVTLALTLEAYATARPAELWHGTRLLARWEVQRAQRTYRLGVTLVPGRTRLQLRAPVAYDPHTQREVSIVALQARITDHVALTSR